MAPERTRGTGTIPDHFVEVDRRVAHALRSVTAAARSRGIASHSRPSNPVTSEYDIQDLAENALRAAFEGVEREEPTPKSAGNFKRIDLIIKSEGVIVECKYVRNAAHAAKIADELRIDFETYHEHPNCRHIFAYVYDPHGYIIDPNLFINNLSGYRKKQEHEFLVTVIVN